MFNDSQLEVSTPPLTVLARKDVGMRIHLASVLTADGAPPHDLQDVGLVGVGYKTPETYLDNNQAKAARLFGQYYPGKIQGECLEVPSHLNGLRWRAFKGG